MVRLVDTVVQCPIFDHFFEAFVQVIAKADLLPSHLAKQHVLLALINLVHFGRFGDVFRFLHHMIELLPDLSVHSLLLLHSLQGESGDLMLLSLHRNWFSATILRL